MIHEEEYSVRLLDMPETCHGFVKESPDGFHTIVLNARLTYEALQSTAIHELEHIEHHDMGSEETADMIEERTHRR